MESTMRNLLSRMSWNSGVARAAVVGLADVAEVVALEGVEDFGGVGFQLRPGPDQAGPGQLCDGGDGVQFGHDAERVPDPYRLSSGKCRSVAMASVVMTAKPANLIWSSMRSMRMSWA